MVLFIRFTYIPIYNMVMLFTFHRKGLQDLHVQAEPQFYRLAKCPQRVKRVNLHVNAIIKTKF